MLLFEALQQLPLIAILRGVKPQEVIAIAEALIQAGIVCLEVPLNSPQALESIALLHKIYQKKAAIGAGTVLKISEIEQVAKNGGSFIVTPNTNSEFIKTVKQQRLMCVPGFFSPSEAFAAISAGADALKLFPAEAITPSVLKALKAVLPPTIPVFPTGGITIDKIAPFVAAGAAGFGLGSALYRPGDKPEQVAIKAKEFVTAFQQLKSNARMK